MVNTTTYQPRQPVRRFMRQQWQAIKRNGVIVRAVAFQYYDPPKTKRVTLDNVLEPGWDKEGV